MANDPPPDTQAQTPPAHARLHAVITREPLAAEALASLILAPEYGALASFIGTVRSPNYGKNVHYIDYEGYEAMMRRQMERVAAEMRERFAVGGIVLAHRLGRLLPGEASIAVMVSSAHRKEALAACSFGIDRCKELLPVWKYEVDDGGGNWVDGSSSAGETL